MKYLRSFKQTGSCSWLAVAMKSRRKDVRSLKRASTWIISKPYFEYDNIIINPQTKPLKLRIKRIGTLLIDYYNNPPSGLDELLKNRRQEHGLDECPYCGKPGSPDTLDHFLPKDDWPEYAIHPNNLVPQCRSCAPIKGTQYYCSNSNVAMFLHPIYDESLSKLRFKIEVDVDGNELKFKPKFSVDQSVKEQDINRLIKHIEKLKLNSRITKFCLRQYTQWKNKLQEKKFDIQVSFNARIQEEKHKDYASNWETAFLQGMLRNKQAMSILQKFATQTAAPEPEAQITLEVQE